MICESNRVTILHHRKRYKNVITFGDFLIDVDQNSCEKMNVFRVFDARLNVIKVIHRFATELSAGVISSEVCSASVCQTGVLPFGSAMGHVHMPH